MYKYWVWIRHRWPLASVIGHLLDSLMVSADNLNFDVLELIFAYVSGSDLPSVALVSRSFLVGAIPKLYRTISFRPAHAKRYPTVSSRILFRGAKLYTSGKVISPFAAVVAHPQLAVHIRAIGASCTVHYVYRIYRPSRYPSSSHP